MTFAGLAQVIVEQVAVQRLPAPGMVGSGPKHTQAVWLDAGCTASLNLTAQKAVFTKIR